MSFSAEWLGLREPLDHASRAPEVAKCVADYFAASPSVSVVDLGCGTGSNLRATFALLPDVQHWLLVDYDLKLLEAARARLETWADSIEDGADGLSVNKGGKRLNVRFRQADLATGVGQLLTPAPDLVTASALFDLISAQWIANFARDVARSGAAFYTVLTYDGSDSFSPPHPLDHAIVAAFAAHQTSDKGFGRAAGPAAPAVLKAAFGGLGYRVTEGSSPWRIKPTHVALARDLLDGIANAVAETGKVTEGDIKAWLAFRLSTIEQPSGLIMTGHTDTFARAKG